MPVQTELYLEELGDRVEEVDVDVQTDAFLDRPPSPMFVPAKTGVDAATQILEGDVSSGPWRTGSSSGWRSRSGGCARRSTGA